MTSEETIEERLEKLAQTISPDETLIENVMIRINELPISDPSIGPAQNIWRTIMRSPIAKLAAVAVIIIACSTGLILWKSTGSGIALADVLTRIEQVASYTYQMRSTITIQETITDLISTVLISQENGIKITTRKIDSNNDEIKWADTYLLPKLNSVIWIVHEKKMYVRLKFDGMKLEYYKEEYNDPRIIIKQILSCDHTSLGQSVIDGITVEGFQTTDSAYEGGFMGQADFEGKSEKVDIRLWVDVNTFLPVRLEENITMKDGRHIHEVSYDFRWNVAVNSDDFKPVIPEGYMSTGEITVPAFKEENAIKGLKIFTSLAGEYPDNLDAVTLNKKARKLIGLDIDTLDDLADDEKTKLTSELMSIMGPAFYYEKLVEDDKDPAYYGQTVRPDDINKVLLRWKLDDGQYRVIYGDLRAETVSPEKLAELENLVRQPSAKTTPTSEQKLEPAKSLHYAAANGNLEQVKSHVLRGADVSAMDERLAGTPLHLAAYYGRPDVVQFLISKGANVNARNKWNRTPLDEAVDRNHSEIAELLHTHGAKSGSSMKAGRAKPVKSLLESAVSKFAIPERNMEISEQMQSCAANLRKIYAAIKKYEKENGTLPIWLSDLVPDYVSKEMLLCPHKPVVTGRARQDPRLTCSYGYEFRMDRRPLKVQLGPAGGVTLRDWKTAQVELFGDVVPMVRCYGHGPKINLDVSGKIYLSLIVWEKIFIPEYYKQKDKEIIKLLEKSSR